MDILNYLKTAPLFLDGGMGTLLQEQGLLPGELPERWNLTHADRIVAIHKAYFDAGSHVVNANTFGANSLKFDKVELEQIIASAMRNARAALETSCGTQPKWIALDIGPTGRMLKPYGDLDFENAVAIFAETVRLGVKHGADLIFIETMNDSYETKAALLAAKETCKLPVFVSNAYGADGKLMTGATPAAMVAMLEGMGADAIGANCSLGPRALTEVMEEYLRVASVPVLLKPNAGLPRTESGCTVYDVSPAEFASEVVALMQKGVRVAGGCCGTTPAYIAELTRQSDGVEIPPSASKEITMVSSYTHAVEFGKKPILIGERINPTGKKRLKEALKSRDMDYILGEGFSQQDAGVAILDVNVGLPEIDEPEMLTAVTGELQAVIDLPLQIDSSDPIAMEQALRRYNGKAMINSVTGKEESMRSVFPLAKKYGGLVVALTLDENGIPETAAGRVEIARKILSTAAQYGLSKKDLIFDPLAMTISADQNAANQTLLSVERISRELGCLTSLGVSNVSFGLPERDTVSSVFFGLALGRGLSAAIINPHSLEMQKAYHAYLALAGLDDNCASYIDFAQTVSQKNANEAPVLANQAAPKVSPTDGMSDLQKAIAKGLREQAARACSVLLENGAAPLSVVQEEIIPALNAVGIGFENKTVYLPQLLMSAEAAKGAFEEIKLRMPIENGGKRCAIVLATVKGDIHDIGKNIVRLLLENYGFAVRDLGRDVLPEDVVAEAVRLHAPLVGLSALMTTTVPAMEETIRRLRQAAPWCRVVVGGAVLNADYAKEIGADHYAKDAMETVRYAETVEKSLAET